jgi:hypothetical protein
MYLRIKRKSESQHNIQDGKEMPPVQEMIIYDSGDQQRRFKRCKVDENIGISLLENCLPLKTIYCPFHDLIGQIVIPQASKDNGNKGVERIQEEYLYYELEPDRDLEAEAIVEDDSWIFQPIANAAEEEESCLEIDEEDSNAEGYYTNEYPDEYGDTYGSSCSLYNNFDPKDYYEE